MIRLGVNIDHVATLRQARCEGVPDILQAARAAEAGGADFITVHLRMDRRHIQDGDTYALKDNGPLPINLEMAASDEMIKHALGLMPQSVCLVPENRQELTTEGGLDAAGDPGRLRETVSRLRESGIEVSLFIDPDPGQIDAALFARADAVEFHTGRYANASGEKRGGELRRLTEGVRAGKSAGLKVNAGHGLDYDNVTPVKDIPGISELNIGYSIICRAVFTGLEAAVREMKALLG